MKRPLTQSQITGRESLPQIFRLFRIAIADCHVVVPNRKLAHLRLLRSRHGKFSNLGARTVGAKNDGSSNGCATVERGEHAVAALVECNVGEVHAVLPKEIGDVSSQPLPSQKGWRKCAMMSVLDGNRSRTSTSIPSAHKALILLLGTLKPLAYGTPASKLPVSPLMIG